MLRVFHIRLSNELASFVSFLAIMVLCLLLASATNATQTARENEPDVVAFHFLAIPGLIEHDGKTGPLAEVLLEIGRRANFKFDMVSTPTNRLIRALGGQKPAFVGLMLDPNTKKNRKNGLRASYPVVFRRDFAFVKAGTPIPKTFGEVSGLTAVTSASSSLSKWISKNFDIEVLTTTTESSAIELIARGRADVWINDETSTLAALKRADSDILVYDPQSPVRETAGRIAFSPLVEAHHINRINLAILEMVIDGTLSRKLSGNFTDHYDEFLEPFFGPPLSMELQR